MGSRTENRKRTLLSLGEAAVDLFESMGPDVTIEAIAKRAGVSRRTAFRHIRSKEELVYIHPILWLNVFDDAVYQHQSSSAKARITLGCRAIVKHIDADPTPVQRAFRVALMHPSLMAGYDAVFQVWIQRLAKEFEPSPETMQARMKADVVGTAVMGAVNTSTREWLMSDGQLTFEEAFSIAFSFVEPLLDAG